MRLKIGFSPCPNDTFIMYGIYNRRVRLSFEADYLIEDVESLNRRAMQGELDITKVSVGVLPFIEDRYVCLSAGAAMGFGCGPILVSKKGKGLREAISSKVASPGRHTTARALFQLYANRPVVFEDLPYDQILRTVSTGRIDYGLLIHESRFTLHLYPVDLLLDLGAWWEERYGLPVPLGVFVIRKELAGSLGPKVEHAIRSSMDLAYNNPLDVLDFSKGLAQEMEESVIQMHIQLYVNEFTVDMGEKGRRAIGRFINEAKLRLCPEG